MAAILPITVTFDARTNQDAAIKVSYPGGTAGDSGGTNHGSLSARFALR